LFQCHLIMEPKVEFDTTEKWEELKNHPTVSGYSTFIGIEYIADDNVFVWESTGAEVDLDAPFWAENEPKNPENQVSVAIASKKTYQILL